MKITEAKAEHIPRIAEIAAESFSDPWSAEGFMSALWEESYCFTAAVEDGAVIGYMVCSLGGEYASVESIAVSPEYRGKGAASLLLEDLFRRTEGRAVSLEVRVSNIAAVSLYEKYGFKKAAVRKNVYERPCEDAAVMIKEDTNA